VVLLPFSCACFFYKHIRVMGRMWSWCVAPQDTKVGASVLK